MRETVEREVTDSIIPGRWAYIHLPPHGGYRSGQKLSASCATALLRLPAFGVYPTLPRISFFVCEKIHGSTCSPSRWRTSPVSRSCENPDRHSLAVFDTRPLSPIRSGEDGKVGGKVTGGAYSYIQRVDVGFEVAGSTHGHHLRGF